MSNENPAPVSTYVRPQTLTEATFKAQATPDITDHDAHQHKTENQGSVVLEDHVSTPSTCVTNHMQNPVVPELRQTPESQFSKYPSMPASSTKKRKVSSMPKAIIGLQFRKMLQEKLEKKEREDQEKLRRKEECLRKKMKEEKTKLKKQKQLEHMVMEKCCKNEEKKMLR